MTESFRYEDQSSERVQLEDGQVEVFFDRNTDRKLTSVILDTAELLPVVDERSYGQLVYDELVLADGTILSPADLSVESKIQECAKSLEPLILFGAGALLRTVEYRREMRFLEIIKNDSSMVVRRTVRETLQQNEDKRIATEIVQHNDMLDDDEGLELWLRLEAIFDPDQELVGRIIIARIACFQSHPSVVGITPLIYDAFDAIITRVPEQLAVNENWLYHEAN